MTTTIRRAQPEDHTVLSTIAYTSKGHWGYSQHLLEEWKPELTVTADDISCHQIFLIENETDVLGYYVLKIDGELGLLDALFVHPNAIGEGLGKRLLEHCTALAKVQNVKIIRVESDPNAVLFYQSYGFLLKDKKESSIAKRYLPVLEKSLQFQLSDAYIYNVTVLVAYDTINDWFNWMVQEHIPAVLATQKFSTAVFTEVLSDKEEGGKTFSIQYMAKDRETLDLYYEKDAPILREQSQRWGEKCLSFRTELKVIHEFEA